MTFTEAVLELIEGRCKGITIDGSYTLRLIDGILYHSRTNHMFIPDATAIRADWQLVEPVPQVEEMEVVRWECDYCGALHRGTYKPSHCHGCQRSIFIELKGIRQIHIKPKLKRRIEVKAVQFEIINKSDEPITIPLNDAKCFMEWTEAAK